MANSPYIDDAYIQMLLDAGNPASTVSLDEDFQDFQGDWMTNTKKGASLAADPSFLITNNLMDYGAFDPLSSYEPVEARGYRRLSQWKQGNPYQQWVAGQLDAGQPASSILAALQKKVAQPTTEQDQAIISYLPTGTFFDQDAGKNIDTGPDMRTISDELKGLETDIASDPSFVIGPDGNPATVTTEDSPMTKKLRSLGYASTPGTPYDPYSLAPAGVTPERDAGLQAARERAAADMAWTGTVAPMARTAADKEQEAYRRFLKEALPVTGRDPATTRLGGHIQQPGEGGWNPDPAKVAAMHAASLNARAHADEYAAMPPGPMSDRFKTGHPDMPPSASSQWGDQIGGWLNSALSGTAAMPGGDSQDQAGDWLNRLLPDNARDESMGRPDLVDYDANAARIRAKRGGVPDRTVANRPSGRGGGGGDTNQSIGAKLAHNVMALGMAKKAAAAQGKAHQAMLAMNDAKKKNTTAAAAVFAAKRQNAMRQALAQQLMSQGHSPFQDEVNRRNAAIYGLGQ